MGMLLALDLGNLVLIGVTAMRANGTIGPANRLKGFAGLILVLKHHIFECGHGVMLQ
jgi:hypothetical protein